MRLCEELIVRGEPTLLATVDEATVAAGKPFLRAFPLSVGPARLARSRAMKLWLDEMAEQGNVRVIHNHSLWKMPNVYPGWTARRFGVPLVVSPRGTLSAWAMASGSIMKKVFWPLLQKPAVACAAAFHATSEAEYRDIRRAGFAQPVFVIPNGIDTPPVGEARKPEIRTLLFLGRIHPIKGLDRLLQAWSVVAASAPDWRLRIVGPDDGGHLAKLQGMARTMPRVEFAGPSFGNSKWREYREADLFILPSRSENFGVSVAEALACATPAIATTGTPWQGLEDNSAGWWIEGSVEGLIACLRSTLSTSVEVLAMMGSNGRAWMQRDFAWPAIAEQMSAAYQWLSAGGARPACTRID